MHRIALALVCALVTLTLATPSHATLNACSAAKKMCVAKKTAAILKCHSKNEKPPAGLPPVTFALCIQKAKDKFDGGANPAKGCFAKLEAKFPGNGCLTTGDTAALEAKVDAFVDDVVCELDAGSGTCLPTPTPTPTPPPNPTPTPTGCLPVGQSCVVGSQCCSLSCMGGMCQPSCSDGIKDGNETGIDCGGGTCPACPLGQGCVANTDCVINSVCMSGMCVCAAGRLDCNNNSVDGCEINTTSDNNSCGSCGLTCPGIQTCINSVCQ